MGRCVGTCPIVVSHHAEPLVEQMFPQIEATAIATDIVVQHTLELEDLIPLAAVQKLVPDSVVVEKAMATVDKLEVAEVMEPIMDAIVVAKEELLTPRAEIDEALPVALEIADELLTQVELKPPEPMVERIEQERVPDSVVRDLHAAVTILDEMLVKAPEVEARGDSSGGLRAGGERGQTVLSGRRRFCPHGWKSTHTSMESALRILIVSVAYH